MTCAFSYHLLTDTVGVCFYERMSQTPGWCARRVTSAPPLSGDGAFFTARRLSVLRSSLAGLVLLSLSRYSASSPRGWHPGVGTPCGPLPSSWVAPGAGAPRGPTYPSLMSLIRPGSRHARRSPSPSCILPLRRHDLLVTAIATLRPKRLSSTCSSGSIRS